MTTTVRSRPRPSSIGNAALVVIPVAFLGYFFVYPLATILITGLSGDQVSGFGPILDVVRSPSLRSVAWFTLWQATASTALTLLLGIPGAYVLSRFDFPGRRAIRAAISTGG